MKGFREGARSKRHLIAISLLIAAMVAVINAAVVFACTGVMGPFLFTPQSGPPGSVLTTSASGLKPYPAKYDIFFGGICMHFSGKLLKTVGTNSAGGWTNVKVTIPKTAKLGQQSLCGIEAYPTPGQTDTDHTAFTVV